jgi:cation:H+ antiporter
VLLVAGAVLLVAGADLLVRGASRLALAIGIPPLVIGLTVVAFGTSAPELAVVVGAVRSGEADVALGNVLGSNIFNLLFILGLSAAITPIVVAGQLVRLDVPLMIGASFLVGGLALDGTIGRFDGAVLFAGMLAYTGFLIRCGRRRETSRLAGLGERPQADRGVRSHVLSVLLVVAGLVLLVVGARWLVSGAVTLAQALGASNLVIGLTIVAAGTSLPEVATSVLASIKGARDIAIGNIVGSNLFNLLAVMGLGGLVAPAGIAVPPGALTFDVPIMIASAVAVLPVLFTGYLIARWEGLVLLAYYGFYTTYLVLEAADHPALSAFTSAMVYFVLPLAAMTLAVVTVRALRGRQGRRHRTSSD